MTEIYHPKVRVRITLPLDQFADCNTPGIAVVARTLSGEQVTQHISPHSPDAYVELVLDQREIVLRLSCGRRDLEAEEKVRRAEGAGS